MRVRVPSFDWDSVGCSWMRIDQLKDKRIQLTCVTAIANRRVIYDTNSTEVRIDKRQVLRIRPIIELGT